jgi:DHA2 family multidrug resistance protein
MPNMNIMPLVGILVNRVDARWLVLFGFVTTAAALHHLGTIYLGIDFRTAVMYRVYQSIGLAFLFVPINTVSYVGVPPEKSNQVSALINLMRNLGGSVGIALITALVARSTQRHQTYLVAHVTPGRATVRRMLSELTQLFQFHGSSPHLATQRAYGVIYRTVGEQAATLSYIDALRMLALLAICVLPFIFLLERSRPGQYGMKSAH